MASGSHEIETKTVTLTVSDGTEMPAYVAQPVSGASAKALLVLQEAFGVNAHIRDVTERFAREGYVAIAPAFFHRTDGHFEGSYTDFGSAMTHMQALTDEGQIADMQAAYEWLTSPSGGQSAAVGSVGYCMGGRASYLADATLPLKASVSYYGGGIAPMPAMGRPGLLERAASLQSPILLIWGGADAHIGPEQRRQVEDALIAAGKTYAMMTFSDADHGFFCDVRASYNPAASHQAWPLTLAFFQQYL